MQLQWVDKVPAADGDGYINDGENRSLKDISLMSLRRLAAYQSQTSSPHVLATLCLQITSSCRITRHREPLDRPMSP